MTYPIVSEGGCADTELRFRALCEIVTIWLIMITTTVPLAAITAEVTTVVTSTIISAVTIAVKTTIATTVARFVTGFVYNGV